MDQVQNSATPVTPPVNSSCEFQREVRFAVVMYGGISLAIYINGVAQELLRMVRATAEDPGHPGQLLIPDSQLDGTEKVYRKVCQILGKDKSPGADGRTMLDGWSPQDTVHVRFVVDVLSGTSAGGINGIFLAKALANCQSLDELKQLWVTEGDIEVLINDRESVKEVTGLSAQKPPQALLNGQRMYRKLLAAFEGMETQQPAGALPPSLVDQVDLFVTTTDIRGLPLPLKLADGVAWERRHKNVFQFSYDRDDGVNDFTQSNNPFLAFAARCTSSFPFAFEPFEFGDLGNLLPSGLTDAKAAEWKQSFFPLYRMPAGVTNHPVHAYDATARAFGDGGYLDNKPFSYAIDALSRRSSALPVDRKLVYVEPSPDHPEDQSTPPGRPNVLENAAAAMSLARYETIREDLQRILDRNRLIERVESYVSRLEKDFDWERRTSLAPTPGFSANDLRNRIRDFGPSYRAYHQLKVSAVTDSIATWITLASGFDLQSDQFLAIRYLASAWREERFLPIVLHDGAVPNGPSHPATENEFLKFYDLDYRVRRLRFVLNRIDQICPLDSLSHDILTDRKQAPPSGEDEIQAFRGAFTIMRKLLSDVLRDFRKLVENLELVGESNPILEDLKPLKIGSEDLLAILEGTGDSDGAMKRAKVLAQKRSEAFGGFAKRLEERLKARSVAAWEKCEQALTPLPDAKPFAVQAYELARHYYDQYEVYDLISFPILYSTEVGDELAPVDVYRISPEDAVSIIDERKTGKRKLAGVTLAHFGAFLDRGFRRNDILWGRLDGAERLITVLLPGDEYQTVREALLKEAQLAIFEEELKILDRGQLSEIVTQAWLGTDSQEKNEKALRALAERKLGASANPAFQAAMRDALDRVDNESLLRFYKEDFNCPREINPELAIRSLARSTQIIGSILQDLGNRYQKDSNPGAWIARLGGWFWGFVEVAVPQSVPNLVFRYWLKLLYFFEALLIVGGLLFSKNVQQLGWTALGVTLLMNLLLFVLTDLLKGRRRWLNAVVVLVAVAIVLLAALGATKLPGTLAAWGVTLHGWIVKATVFLRTVPAAKS